METRLNTKQVAELKGCSEQFIRKLAKEGKLKGEKPTSTSEWEFSIDAIAEYNPDLVLKYFYQLKASLPTPSHDFLPERKASKPLDHYSAEEREEIAWWLRTVEDWQRYRNKYPGSKAEADDKFITLCAKTDPGHKLSVDMLYRRQRALDENDLDGLVNKRGKNRKGKSSIPEPVWQAFLLSTPI